MCELRWPKCFSRNYPYVSYVWVELIASMSWRRRLCDHSCLPSRHHPNEESWKDSMLIKTKSRVNQVDQLTKRRRYQLKQVINEYHLDQLDQWSYVPHEKDIMIWAKECSKEIREAPHGLCTHKNFFIQIQSAQKRITAPPKSIETNNKCKWAYRKLSLVHVTNTWLSNKWKRQLKNGLNQNDVCESRQCTWED